MGGVGLVSASTVKYHYFHCFFTYSVGRSACVGCRSRPGVTVFSRQALRGCCTATALLPSGSSRVGARLPSDPGGARTRLQRSCPA